MWCGVVAAHHHAAPAHAQDLTSGGFPKVVCRVWFGRAKVKGKDYAGGEKGGFLGCGDMIDAGWGGLWRGSG